MFRTSTARLGVGSYNVFLRVNKGKYLTGEMKKNAMKRALHLGEKFWELPAESRAVLAAQGMKTRHKTTYHMKKKRVNRRGMSQYHQFIREHFKKVPRKVRLAGAPAALKHLADQWKSHKAKHGITTETEAKTSAAIAAASAATTTATSAADGVNFKILGALSAQLENILEEDAATKGGGEEEETIAEATKTTEDAIKNDMSSAQGEVDMMSAEKEREENDQEEEAVMTAADDVQNTDEGMPEMSDAAAQLLPLAAALARTQEAKTILGEEKPTEVDVDVDEHTTSSKQDTINK